MPIIVFADYPEFKPNMTPQQMFKIGIMGGCYFRTIKSPRTNKIYRDQHKKYNKILNGIPLSSYGLQKYDKSVNYYNVKVGTSYEYWMSKHWIREDVDPFGWIEWYCNFYLGRRTIDDKRQIDRWLHLAGKSGRFRKQLQNKINAIGKNDQNIYPRMRQTLLHWAFDSRKLKPESSNAAK